MEYKKYIVALLLFALAPLSLLAQRHTVSGTVVERGSRETLIGATVSVVGKSMGVATNGYGFYSITLPEADTVVLEFSYVGYTPQRVAVNLRRNQTLNIELEPSQHSIEGVEVHAESRTSSRSAQMSVVELPIRQAKAIPMLLGEKDMLKALQLMPGVQSGNDGSSSLYVRGGGPDQNLVILDDATVYNLFHVFGFVSLFNGDAIKNIELIKGGFPARYGSRLSSVLDIAMRDGRKDSISGEAGIGVLSSRIMLEGPIVKDKASFIVSARRSWIDLYTRLASKVLSDMNFYYYFYDLTAKLNWEVNARNKLYLSGYFGRDKLDIGDGYKTDTTKHENNQGEFWGNATTTLRWNHIFNEQLFSNLSAIFSNYRFNIYNQNEYTWRNKFTEQDTTQSVDRRYQSGIRDYGLKYDLTWYPTPNHTIRAGALATLHTFRPEVKILRDERVSIDTRNEMLYRQFELAFYVEDEMRLGSFGVANVGARLSSYTLGVTKVRHHIDPHVHIEPRASLTVFLGERTSAKASYTMMNQYIHLLSNTGTGMPTDLWVPATENVPAQRSWQMALGLTHDIKPTNTTISVEGYYKRMNNVIEYLPGATHLSLKSENTMSGGLVWENNVTSGTGRAYGVEFLAHRKNGRLQGWVGYTLSWIKHRFDQINKGREYYPRHDRRHDIALVAMYDVNEKIKLSATWVYGTGNYIDVPLTQYQAKALGDEQYNTYRDQTVYSYTEKNTFQMSAYHRLDLAAQFYRFKTRTTRIWEIGVYNAYNRLNPYYYDMATDPNTGKTTLIKQGLFPILPSLSWTIKF